MKKVDRKAPKGKTGANRQTSDKHKTEMNRQMEQKHDRQTNKDKYMEK